MKTFLLYKLNSLLKGNLLSPLLKGGWGVLAILLTLFLSIPISAQFGVGGTLRNAKAFPTNPQKRTILAYNDTIWVYTGTGGWKSLYEAGYPDAIHPSVLFYDSAGCGCWVAKELIDITDSIQTSEIQCSITPITAANINDGDIVELIPAPGVGNSIVPIRFRIHMLGDQDAGGAVDPSFMEIGTIQIQSLDVTTQLCINGEGMNLVSNTPFQFMQSVDLSNKALNIHYLDAYYGTNRAGTITVWYNIISE